MIRIIAWLLAVIMAAVSPILNRIDGGKPAAEGTFMETQERVKTGRTYEAFAPGEKDIVLSGGDLAGALENIREMRAGGDTERITVWLHGGVYNIGGTLDFDGLSDVRICACPGERVTLTSGFTVTGFTETRVNGVRVWRADVPAGSAFRSLYKGEQALRLTRYPEQGYLTVKAPDRENSLFTDDDTPWLYTYGDRSFYYGDDLGEALFYQTGRVRIKLMHYWMCENTALSGVADGKLYLTRPASMRISAGDRYFLENVFEALKNPGEWYLDTKENILYYVPEDGDTRRDTVLFAPDETVLASLKNARNIEFRNLRFFGTDPTDPAGTEWIPGTDMLFPQGNPEYPGAVEIAECEGIGFYNCDFLNIGSTAVRFTGRNADCDIRGCLFRNIGCNAVFIRGENAAGEERRTCRINVTDNLIDGYGRVCPTGIGVLLHFASDCDIAHNEIRDGYYTAVSVGWVWGYAFHATDGIRIRDNLIYNIGQGWLSDMGGIYTLGVQPHTVISGNVIHNVAADPGEGGYGGWGIYLDEGSSFITVKNNLVYDCGSQSFHQHYGQENLITNNIFAFSDEGQIRASKTEDHNEFTLTGNIVVGEDQPLWVNAGERRFTESGNLFWDYVNFSRVYAVNGASIGKKTDRVYAAALKLGGYFTNDAAADPIFRDPANRDFTLAAESPALTEIGFTPWDIAAAGTLSDFG